MGKYNADYLTFVLKIPAFGKPQNVGGNPTDDIETIDKQTKNSKSPFALSLLKQAAGKIMKVRNFDNFVE